MYTSYAANALEKAIQGINELKKTITESDQKYAVDENIKRHKKLNCGWGMENLLHPKTA